MTDMEQFKTELPQLPLLQREEMSELLRHSIAEEHAKLAAEEEAEHLKIVEERIAEYETGNIQMIPFGETIDRIFGKL